MPSRGLPEVRKAICDWYGRRYGAALRSGDARRSSPSARRRGSPTCCWRSWARATACCRPTPATRSTASASSSPAASRSPSPTGPGRDPFGEIEAALARSPRKPKGLIVNYPAQPDQRGRRPGLLREGGRAGAARDRSGSSPISPTPICPSTAARPPASSRCRARASWRSSSSPSRRATRCRGGASASASATADARRRASATIKGYLDYGIFGPAQLAAATALASCDADVAANRALYKHRAALLCDGLRGGRLAGPAPRGLDVRLGAAARAPGRPPWARSASPPSCSRRPGSPWRPASASGPAGRATSASRWSSPTTARARPAARSARYLVGKPGGPGSHALTKPQPSSRNPAPCPQPQPTIARLFRPTRRSSTPGSSPTSAARRSDARRPKIADVLRGKHRPTFTTHADAGDFVVVVNADKVQLTGKKWSGKLYRDHSLFPGGLRTQTAPSSWSSGTRPTWSSARSGACCPRARSAASIYKKLKVYAGAEHPHAAQQPKPLKFTVAQAAEP